MLVFFVFHVSVYDKDLYPMITLNKQFKTPVRKMFPRVIVCRRLQAQGRCRRLLRLCWPIHRLCHNSYHFRYFLLQLDQYDLFNRVPHPSLGPEIWCI